MILPVPGDRYSRDYQHRLNAVLEAADRGNFKKGQDMELEPARIILTSPNGTRFALVVSNTGTLSTIAAPPVGRGGA